MIPYLGWRSDEGASSTLAGVELWSIIEYGQLDNPQGLSSWKQLYALAAYLHLNISMFVLQHNFASQPIFCTLIDKKKGYPKAVQFLTVDS